MAPTNIVLMNMNMSLSARSRPDNYDNPKREELLGRYLFGWALVALVIVFLAVVFAKYKKKLTPKLHKCKENLEFLGDKMPWTSLRGSKSAYVANHHIVEVLEVDRITADLIPEYLKKTAAVMGCI
ncbi:hypothetical protein N7508_001123 [Penicillium antarcticum]|uniref:uncharacterized protein n=1 Tax=Penicillium antarcticum TaxID=416450 RepID=UPI0023A731EF|nr:uncharacterized protein N7508_001123 [Penicillium antarcticum]KAJ5316615.1 hypothetical protein N7508_001123 [Penicillium antarcticum]